MAGSPTEKTEQQTTTTTKKRFSFELTNNNSHRPLLPALVVIFAQLSLPMSDVETPNDSPSTKSIKSDDPRRMSQRLLQSGATGCCDGLTDHDVFAKLLLRIAGGFCFVLGFISMGIDALAYADFSTNKVGSWWGGIFVIITGTFGLISTPKLTVWLGCISSAVSLVIALAAVALDGAVAGTLSSLAACANPPLGPNGESSFLYYGSSSYYQPAAQCIENNWDKNTQCYCTTQNNDCYMYSLAGGESCGYILSNVAPTMAAATVFDCFMLVANFGMLAANIFSLFYSRKVALAPDEVMKTKRRQSANMSMDTIFQPGAATPTSSL